jgi:hypothetical protein
MYVYLTKGSDKMRNQLKLFSPFFNLEIDFKNDYISYIDTTHNNATSVIHNNIVNHLKTKKFGVKSDFKKMTTTAKIHSIKLSKIAILAYGIIRDSIALNDSYLNNRSYISTCTA